MADSIIQPAKQSIDDLQVRLNFFLFLWELIIKNGQRDKIRGTNMQTSFPFFLLHLLISIIPLVPFPRK